MKTGLNVEVTMDERNYNLWLYCISGIGSAKIEHMLGVFGTAERVFHATSSELAQIEGLTNENIKNILDNASDEVLLARSNWIKERGVAFLSRLCADYPQALREIVAPPFGLFVKGKLPDDDAPRVAIIGSRRCTEYGRSVSHKLALELAAAGVVVVSGFAKGIDSVAHKAALQAGGETIGVMGCGIDICYPAENKQLMNDITNSGCLMSAYLPSTKPLPAYFPARNRIISGLCKAIIVVEASMRSGTLITVGHALEQGREVFAVPGSILSSLSEGTNLLIKEGAAVATSAEDIISVLGIKPKNANTSDKEQKKSEKQELDNSETAILRCIRDAQPAMFDHIAHTTGLATSEVNYVLVMLEMKGFVEKLPGLRYIAKV
ncbi:MAG: DNA-processing protein DprA [Defluviitaleaceae bacterium]|nr:DNA-processing protein DprA [Defluviitaleaceae bacterium]